MATPLSNNTFLNLILEGCALNEKEELRALLSKLGGDMSDLKFRVKEVIEDRYVNFTKLAQEHRHFLNKARSLTLEIDELVMKVKNRTTPSLKESTSEIQELTASLHEVCTMSTFVNHLLDIDTTFQTINRFREKKEYSEMARSFTHVRAMLDEPPSKASNLEIYQALANEYALQCAAFMDDMQTILSECIKFETTKSEDLNHFLMCTLQIDVSRSEEISQMFPALNYLESETLYLKRFAEKIFKLMLTTIVKHGASVTEEQNGKNAMLIVEAKPSEERCSHKTVFENVLKVFQFIHGHLAVRIDDDFTLLNKLGAAVGEDFCNLLVEHCLSITIPSHMSQLNAYQTVANDTADFWMQVTDIGFLNKENKTLLDYVSNVEYLCADKSCRTLLYKAREIMKKDLYDMMEIESQTDLYKDADNFVKTENISSIMPEIDLSKNTFRFPKCQISKSALELLNLISDVLLECSKSTDSSAVRLFYTARNIVELYCAVVPTHHQTFLEAIPQHVALFHNNCMYLSHCLLTVGDAHRSLLPQVLKDHLLTFVDQVTELRVIGTTVFLKHMQTQRNQLLAIIRDSGLAELGKSSDTTSGMEKALRQCMRQLELLQSVWQPVLPDSVYCKAIGCLVNAFVEELITRVVSAEDIPADTAMQLVEMFKIVSSRMPLVFMEPKAVHHHVKKWGMFLELVSILGANLREISDRWANGKGPIAHLFQPEQVKQLVRALFQNTERRSVFLSGIK